MNFNLFKNSRSIHPSVNRSTRCSLKDTIHWVTSAKTGTKDTEPKCTKTGLHVCSDIMLLQTRVLQLHSRRVYRKLKCNHKTLPQKRTQNATNPSNDHSCNTISHPNWANCPLQQLLSPQGAIFTGGVSASIWENYQKTTDDTGKPLQLHLGTTTFTALLKMKVPNGGFYSDATEEPFWLLKETFSERFLKNQFFLNVKNI